MLITYLADLMRKSKYCFLCDAPFVGVSDGTTPILN
jgi:hypothetical protein